MNREVYTKSRYRNNNALSSSVKINIITINIYKKQ